MACPMNVYFLVHITRIRRNCASGRVLCCTGSVTIRGRYSGVRRSKKRPRVPSSGNKGTQRRTDSRPIDRISSSDPMPESARTLSIAFCPHWLRRVFADELMVDAYKVLIGGLAGFVSQSLPRCVQKALSTGRRRNRTLISTLDVMTHPGSCPTFAANRERSIYRAVVQWHADSFGYQL